jgi:hypothetical protein
MKFKAVFETETYISDAGYYVITQKNRPFEEDSVILLSACQLKELASDMSEHYICSDWWETKNED